MKTRYRCWSSLAQPSLRLLGRGALQEASGAGLDTVDMFRTCTRYSALISHPDQLQRQLTNALLSAYQPTPGPVHLSIPMDVLRTPMKTGPAYNLAHLLKPLAAVDDAAVRELQAILAQTRKVVVLIGSGCGEAIDLIIELVERMGGVFVVTPDAKGYISPRHPLYRGVFGFAGHRSAVAAVEDKDVDLILVAGSNLSEWTSNGWSEAVLNNRLVHIDPLESHLARSPMARLHVLGAIRPVFERRAANAAQRRSGTDFRRREAKIQKGYGWGSVQTCFCRCTHQTPVSDARTRLAQPPRYAFPDRYRQQHDLGESIIWRCTTTSPAREAGYASR